MKNTLLMAVALVGLAAGIARPVSAGTVATLQDWCFNVNGDIADLCNGGATPTLGGTVNGVGTSGGMDLSVATEPNGLGSASFVVGPGSSYISAYMDYDLNFDAEGSYSDSAAVNGALPAGYSYEIDDPNTSSLYCGQSCFGDFGAGSLNNQNNVGAFELTPNTCCDVAWALGVSVSVANGFQDTVTFNVSDTAPASGFYLTQSNGVDTTQNLYLSASVTSQQVGPSSGTPEPGTFVLLGAGLVGLVGWRVRSRRAVNA